MYVYGQLIELETEVMDILVNQFQYQQEVNKVLLKK